MMTIAANLIPDAIVLCGRVPCPMPHTCRLQAQDLLACACTGITAYIYNTQRYGHRNRHTPTFDQMYLFVFPSIHSLIHALTLTLPPSLTFLSELHSTCNKILGKQATIRATRQLPAHTHSNKKKENNDYDDNKNKITIILNISLLQYGETTTTRAMV